MADLSHRNFSKAIGIIGGAGPMASAFLYTTILRTCQESYGANDYDQFPEIILISYPFTRGKRDLIQRDLSHCFAKLEGAGANLFCIASHTFHGFLPHSSIPAGFINLVDVGISEAIHCNISKSLILAAPATISMKLYERSHIQCVYPMANDQEEVNQIIREVAGGVVNEHQSERLGKVIARCMEAISFDGIIMACTELPLVHAAKPIAQGIPVVDPVAVLAKRLVESAREKIS